MEFDVKKIYLEDLRELVLEGGKINNKVSEEGLNEMINNTFVKIEKVLEESDMQHVYEQIIDEVCVLMSSYEETFFKLGMKIGVQLEYEKR